MFEVRDSKNHSSEADDAGLLGHDSVTWQMVSEVSN
jgi:hypothetical protein